MQLIELPAELYEGCEGIFDYAENIKDIYSFMKNIGIEYSKNLDDVWNNKDVKCRCTSCINPNYFIKIDWNDKSKKCKFGYYHS